jgi:hypothetical protein
VTSETRDGHVLCERGYQSVSNPQRCSQKSARLPVRPRIRNLAEGRLYAFGAPGIWPSHAPFIAGRPDEKLIAAHWDDVLRLTAPAEPKRLQRQPTSAPSSPMGRRGRRSGGTSSSLAARPSRARQLVVSGSQTPRVGCSFAFWTGPALSAPAKAKPR